MWNIVKPRRFWCLSTPLQRRFGPQSLAALLPCQAIGGHRAWLDFQAVQKHPSTSVFVNFASFRSVHEDNAGGWKITRTLWFTALTCFDSRHHTDVACFIHIHIKNHIYNIIYIDICIHAFQRWVAAPQSHGIPFCGVGGGVGSMYIYVI